MPNEQGGAIQVLDNTVEAINQALAQLLERVDDLKGLRGPVTIHDRMGVDAPLDPTDAVNLESLINDFASNLGAPYAWPVLTNTQRPSEMQGEDSQLDPADPLLWMLTDRFVIDEEGLDLHDPFFWLFTSASIESGSGQEPQNAPPEVAASSAIGTILERYAAEDHTHGVTTGTFTVTGTGFTATVDGTATYVVVASRFAVVFLPTLTGTSNATTFTLTGIPAVLQPATLTGWSPVLRGQDNGVNAGNKLVEILAASGTWNVWNGMNVATAWTAGGVKTLYATWLAYVLL